MKRILLFMGSLLVLGCSQAEICSDEKASQSYSFVVSSETKSVFSEGFEAVEWSRGDRMCVFDGVLNNKFVTEERGRRVTFSGPLSSTANELVFLYPYIGTAGMESATIVGQIQPVQWAAKNGFSNGANIAVGRGKVSESTVALFNAGGYVSISLPAGLWGITSIDLKATGGETLSGTVRISFDNDGIPVTQNSGGNDYVSISAPGDTIAAGEKYYFVANPVTMASGFTVTLHRKDGKKASFASTKSNTIRRNKVLNLGVVAADSLTWSEDPELPTKTLVFDFTNGAWPFDEAPGNVNYPEYDKTYVSEAGGYMLHVSGKSYYDEDFNCGTHGAVSPCIALPGLDGYILKSVRSVSGEESVPAFFTDEENNADLSIKGIQETSTDHSYRISGAKEGQKVLMRSYTSIKLNSLVLEYEQVSSESTKSVISVTTLSNDGQAEFTYSGGTSTDYEYGVEYLPLGTKVWKNASLLSGTKVSESEGKVIFSVSLPAGDCMARAYARPVNGNGDKYYGPIWYPASCQVNLHVDFTSACPFSPSGTTASGSGEFNDPRKGIGFPTGAQKVLNQTTGETSNYGAGYWTGELFVAYFPYTEYVFSSGGVDYKFKLGVPHGGSDRYIYWSKSYRLRTAYYVITYPVISGFRLAKIAYSQSTRSSAPPVFMGVNDTPTSLGETNTGGQPAYQYYYTPTALGSQTVFSSTCRHIFHIDRIDLQYIKCNE